MSEPKIDVQLQHRAPRGARARARVTMSRPLLLVAAAMLAVTTTSFMRVPLLPEIGNELRLTTSQVALVTTAFAIGRLATDLPAGWIVDHVTAPVILAGSTFVVALASAGLALVQSLAPVLVCFCAIGIGSAVSNTAGMKVFSTRSLPGSRGRAMAMFTSVLVTGQTIGPGLGGVLADLGSWRTAPIAGAAICVLALGACVAYAREGRSALPGGAAHRRRAGSSGGVGLAPLERVAVLGLGFSTFFVLGSLPQTLMPLIGADELGLSPSAIGLALLAAGVARLPGSWLTGVISDRVSQKAAVLPAMTCMAGSVALLALPLTSASWMAAIVLISFFSGTNAVGAAIIAERSPDTSVGRNIAAYRLAMDAGLLAGPALVALVYQSAGRAAVFVPVGVLVLAAVCAALWISDPRHAVNAA